MKPSCKTDSAHPALFTSIRWPKATVPRREQTLAMFDRAVDWKMLEEIARPFYQADVRRTGRKGYSLAMMLRCYALQCLWRMSDRQAEAAIFTANGRPEKPQFGHLVNQLFRPDVAVVMFHHDRADFLLHPAFNRVEERLFLFWLDEPWIACRHIYSPNSVV